KQFVVDESTDVVLNEDHIFEEILLADVFLPVSGEKKRIRAISRCLAARDSVDLLIEALRKGLIPEEDCGDLIRYAREAGKTSLIPLFLLKQSGEWE
ncbi:MAG: hypothetical protein K6G83_08315, partial [Lachnospiraceae bacterium]|nr:hypothetical protein [Lachnospiraceae bacterium]